MVSRKIVFLMVPEIHLMDMAGPAEVFSEAIEFGADIRMEYCSIGGSITSTGGLTIGKLPRFDTIKMTKGDYLFIPGAPLRYLMSGKFETENKFLFEWIRSCASRKVNICSVCSGAFILARSGVLDYKQCTTHFKQAEELQKHFPKLKVSENVLFVKDNNIFTSAGIASGIDLALSILEDIHGPYFAHKVARELVIYVRRSGSHAQKSIFVEYRNHIHSGIHKVQDFLIDNIHKKTSVRRLAEIACMSERNFTRLFKKEAGITVNGYTTLVRMERISELMKNPDLTRQQIARHVGLQSDRQLSRLIYAQKFNSMN